MIKRWGDSSDEEMSGLMLGGCEVSHAELQEIAISALGAIEAGVPADLVAEYQEGGGSFEPGDLHRWLLARAEPADPSFVLVHSYSRADALRDGVLYDVSEMAREAKFKIPVAVTAAVRAQYILVPPGVECQDEAGRTWDIIWMLMVTIGRDGLDRDTIEYQVLVRNDNKSPKPVWLKAVCSGDDEGSPCITIMLRGED